MKFIAVRFKFTLFVFLLIFTFTNFLYPGIVEGRIHQDDDGWHIYRSGAFKLSFGTLVIDHCYPSIDGREIRPSGVEVERSDSGGRIEYMWEAGRLTLILSKINDAYTIETRLEGWKNRIDWIYPLAGGQITGADEFYRQGAGFSGPSGLIPIPAPIVKLKFADELRENAWSYDSYLFTGLISHDNQTLVISAFDHTNYLHRSTLYNRQHRFGLIDRHLDTNIIFFESGFGIEGIKPAQDTLTLPTIFIQPGFEPYKTLQLQAIKMASSNQIKLNLSPRYYYCSWYEFNRNFSEKILDDMLTGMESLNIKPCAQTIQIDDGYCWNGEWLKSNERYPSGIEKVVQKIKDHGYDAGIWVAPFMVSSNSFIFKDHKEWLLRDLSGDPILEWENEEEDVYVLDSSHPDAFSYLQRVFRTFREYGITSYKTDFMDWGLRDSKMVLRYTPGKTSVQYFNDVVEMIRKEIGSESYWLGCISFYQPMVGYADGMRVSNDVGDEWTDISTRNMFREMYCNQFFNNVLWQNDPDVLYLRDYSISLTEMERESIALWDGMIGGTITTSCRFHTLNDRALNLWRFLKPADVHISADVPFWSTRDSIYVVVREYPQLDSKSILFLNTTDYKLTRIYSIRDLYGFDQAFCYLWLPDKNEFMGHRSEVKITLKGRECQLIYLSRKNEPPSNSPGISGIDKHK